MSKPRTISDAVLRVMQDAGRPLSAREAYDRIVEADLYTFHATRPEHVVAGQIRRHCRGLDLEQASRATAIVARDRKSLEMPCVLA